MNSGIAPVNSLSITDLRPAQVNLLEAQVANRAI